jgi:hypothetical protein
MTRELVTKVKVFEQAQIKKLYVSLQVNISIGKLLKTEVFRSSHKFTSTAAEPAEVFA